MLWYNISCTWVSAVSLRATVNWCMGCLIGLSDIVIECLIILTFSNCPLLVTKSVYLVTSCCRSCCWDRERSEDDKSKTELDDWVDVHHVLGVLLSTPVVKRFCAGVQCPIAIILNKITSAGPVLTTWITALLMLAIWLRVLEKGSGKENCQTNVVQLKQYRPPWL